MRSSLDGAKKTIPNLSLKRKSLVQKTSARMKAQKCLQNAHSPLTTNSNQTRQLRCVPFRQRSRRNHAHITRCAGFGKSESSKSKKTPRFLRLIDEDGSLEASNVQSTNDSDNGWFVVENVDPKKSFVSKPIVPIILKSGRAICIFKPDQSSDKLYCTDANSTAYGYPLADASLIKSGNKILVEVKLDGTQYELQTGKVVSWCPKNNFVRGILGTLKDKAQPVDLPVHAVRVDGDKVWVKLSN